MSRGQDEQGRRAQMDPAEIMLPLISHQGLGVGDAPQLSVMGPGHRRGRSNEARNRGGVGRLYVRA